MQRPTVANIRIRSTGDAHLIFHAVATGRLAMITRRLDAEERKAIVSGCVYVWEERTADSDATGMGIERWTDSFRWGPSRVRDDFLFYQEKDPDPDDHVHNEKESRWARMMRRRSQPNAPPVLAPSTGFPHSGSLHKRPPADPERMVKQTYSVIVKPPGDPPDRPSRKWHLTAYFTQASIDGLGVVDDILAIRDQTVPPGMFRSARNGKQSGKKRDDADARSRRGAQDIGPGVGVVLHTPGEAGPGQYSFPASPYPPYSAYTSAHATPAHPPLSLGVTPPPQLTSTRHPPPYATPDQIRDRYSGDRYVGDRYTGVRGGTLTPSDGFGIHYSTSPDMSPSPVLRSPQYHEPHQMLNQEKGNRSSGYSSGYSSNSSSNDHGSSIGHSNSEYHHRQQLHTASRRYSGSGALMGPSGIEPSLVPLEVLSNLPSASRNPEDERVLRQLTHSSSSRKESSPSSTLTLSKATFS